MTNELLPCLCCGQHVYIVDVGERYSAYAVAHTDTKGECRVTLRAPTKGELQAVWNRRHSVSEAA